MKNVWKLYDVLPLKGIFPSRLGNPMFLFSLLFSLFSFSSSVTAQEVEASIDTASIKIGEQITYSIAVETDSTNLVVFPEGQTFSPLEMVESISVDTSRAENGFRLLKEYMLTQFDSGSYTIPQQRVLINETLVLTDSLQVEVATVVVDTTSQKMYPIKPSIEVPSGAEFPAWAWWLLGLILLGGLIYFFFRRKKKKEAEAKKLPPYEQAMFELQQLDSSPLLEQRETKEYYSQLSAAVRRYLDEEVYDHALESTSGELILYLETEKNAGKLKIEQSTIDKLRVILQRADLAKFANSRPDVITAKEDRSNVEYIINDTKAGIPEPTEEELQKDLEYQQKMERKKKRKKIALGAGITFLVLGIFIAYMISTKGFSYLIDTYWGHPTKELLENDWIRSEYGTPSVAITTPEVLIRTETENTGLLENISASNETFAQGDFFGNYYVELNSFMLDPQADFDIETAINAVASYLEDLGARNIITKREGFTTLNGAEGIKVFGNFDIENPITNEPITKQYAILNFTENNGFQQIVVIYNEDDTYAEEITQRILNSVELRNTGN